MNPINIFYEEPESDRWFKYDRYPRKLIRRIIRGKTKPGGVMMVALELMRGLKKLNIPFRYNDYKYAKQNPEELIGVIGKSHLIFDKKFKNPILFGAGIFSHPTDCPDLFEKFPNVKQMLVPGEWMENMCKPYYGDKVNFWPVGIDTEKWNQSVKKDATIDFLIYDKVRWEYEKYEKELINPIKAILNNNNISYHQIRYGRYNHQELIDKLSISKAVIFLCEHETQGLAYQQILSTNTPILAWDRGGFWQDPTYFPHRAQYQPVSSVPYWDNRCGIKFKDIYEFEGKLKMFTEKLSNNDFKARDYILQNLTLEICAKKYSDIYQSLAKTLN